MSSRLWFLPVLTGLVIGAMFTASRPSQAAPKKSPVHKPGAGKGHSKPGYLPPLATAAAALTPPAAQASDLMLYNGLAPDQSSIALSSWGGGSVTDNALVSFSQGHSLQITTLDFYQGAKLSLQPPVDLGSLADPARVMIFMLRLTAGTRNLLSQSGAFTESKPRLVLAQFSQGRPPGGYPPQGNYPPRGGYPPPMGFPPPGSMQNVPGFNAAPQAAPLPAQALRFLHFIFTRADGSQADVLRPYPDLSQTDAGAGAEQWVPISIPLAALHFATGSAVSPLQSIVLAGNDYAVLYLGQIRLTRDTTPITCFAGASITASTNEPVVLHGTAEGGASSLTYSWDFDASDGITPETTGPTVTTQFLKAKDYTATLTVSDIDGVKTPATSTVVIHVQ